MYYSGDIVLKFLIPGFIICVKTYKISTKASKNSIWLGIKVPMKKFIYLY